MDLSNKIDKGNNKISTYKEIIDANMMNNFLENPLWFDQFTNYGYKAIRGIFQSGVFIVPERSGSNPSYSFLRFAALESYKLWHQYKGNSYGWPDISSVTTLLETIDSDYSGITGETGDSKIENQKQNDDVLAEAGIYRWDWREVKDDKNIIEEVKTKIKVQSENELDTERKGALQKFANLYSKAEAEKRKDAADKDIFNLYFPEPATRISSYAVNLLFNSGLMEMKLPEKGNLGSGRESIGLIAGLVYLDIKNKNYNTNREKRAKSKLLFNPDFVVTTSLGDKNNRKEDFVNLFLNWYRHNWERKVDWKNNDDLTVFEKLPNIEKFDQSYFNENKPNQVSKWHYNTLKKMNNSESDFVKSFFQPESK